MKIELHRCPPLLAWISEQTCQRNAELARSSKRAGPSDAAAARRINLRECVTCPGVLELRAGTREIHVPDPVGRAPRKRGRAKVVPGSVARQPRGKPGSIVAPGAPVRRSASTSRKKFVRQPAAPIA